MINRSEDNWLNHDRSKVPFETFKSPDIIVNMVNTEDTKIDISDGNVINTTKDFSQAKTKDGDKVLDDNTNFKVGDEKTEANNIEDNGIDKKGNVDNGNKNDYIVMQIYSNFDQQQRQRPRFQPNNQWYGGQDIGGPPLDYDPATRNSFVKLVMIIVLVMLIITAAFIAYVIVSSELKEFFQQNSKVLFISSTVLLLAIHYAFDCSPCTRMPPCNFICLILVVVIMSVIVATVSARYRTEVLLYSAIATTVVVLVCILLACSRFDFTSWLLYVVVFATVFMVISLILLAVTLITGSMMKPILIVQIVVATLIQVVMLIIELQMILGGKTVELSEDDYALGAYLLYTSIVSIFLNMVHLIGLGDD